jgi:hypothetical protein
MTVNPMLVVSVRGGNNDYPSILRDCALIAMMVFCALEQRLQLAPLGFRAASLILALSVFALGGWPFALVAVGFAVEALRRWYVTRGREHQV